MTKRKECAMKVETRLAIVIRRLCLCKGSVAGLGSAFLVTTVAAADWCFDKQNPQPQSAAANPLLHNHLCAQSGNDAGHSSGRRSARCLTLLIPRQCCCRPHSCKGSKVQIDSRRHVGTGSLNVALRDVCCGDTDCHRSGVNIYIYTSPWILTETHMDDMLESQHRCSTKGGWATYWLLCAVVQREGWTMDPSSGLCQVRPINSYLYPAEASPMLSMCACLC